MPAKSDLPQGSLVHGYAITQRLQQVSRDVVQVPQASLYPALHRLENRGPSGCGLEGDRDWP